MKIAVACDAGKVSGHFGHCASFEIFETEGDHVLGVATVPNPGHQPGFLPNFLNDRGVEAIIVGGMGAHAISLFESNGIEVLLGAEGPCAEAVGSYLAGTLESRGSTCHEHQHHDDCGGH